MRRALEDARAENPPPSLKQIGRRLGYTAEVVVVQNFPDLCKSYKDMEKDGSGAKTANTEDDGSMQRFAPLEELFKGRHFDQEIVVLCVRWYLSFRLSYRDLVAMMAERGIDLAHTTILRWVQHYTPELEKRWKRFARARSAGPGEWMRHI